MYGCWIQFFDYIYLCLKVILGLTNGTFSIILDRNSWEREEIVYFNNPMSKLDKSETQRRNLVVESSCDPSHLRVQELWVWVVTSLTIVRMIPHHAWQSLSRRRQWPYTWASFFIIKIYKKIKIKIKWDLREKTQHGYQGLRLFWPSVPYQTIGPVPPQPNWLSWETWEFEFRHIT